MLRVTVAFVALVVVLSVVPGVDGRECRLRRHAARHATRCCCPVADQSCTADANAPQAPSTTAFEFKGDWSITDGPSWRTIRDQLFNNKAAGDNQSVQERAPQASEDISFPEEQVIVRNSAHSWNTGTPTWHDVQFRLLTLANAVRYSSERWIASQSRFAAFVLEQVSGAGDGFARPPIR